MADAGRRNLPSGLQHSSGQLSCGDEVDVVPDLLANETTKQEKFAGGSRSGGEGMPISWEWRRRWGLGRGNSGPRKSDWRV